MMPPKPAKQTVPRKSRRTTTGCVTCRSRHVKCDERKPTCQNCEAIGRVCQGYVTGRLSRQKAQSPYEAVVPLLGLIKAQSTLLPRGISSTVLGSAQEYSNLEFFNFWMNTKCSDVLGSRLWDLLVLRASQTEPVIKHLVMALTTILREYYEFQSLNINGSFGAAAIVHYNKAIHHARDLLRTASSRRQVNIGLMACLLFVYFDNMVGNYSMAQGHLQSGAKILLERRQSSRWVQPSWDTSERLLHADMAPSSAQDQCEPVIEATFERLELQDMAHFNPAMASPDLILRELREFMPTTPPAAYKYLPEARDRLMDLTVAAFKTSNAVVAIRMKEPPLRRHPLYSAFKKSQAHYMNCLDHWLVAFEAFLQSHRVPTFWGTAADLSQKKPAWPYLLLLYHVMTTLTVKTCLVEDETVWDKHMDSFTSMIKLAKIVMGLASSEHVSVPSISAKINPESRYLLAFDTGPIFPISVITQKCRDPTIRHHAIQLLQDYPRREGIFSSTCMAKLAEIIVQHELKGAPNSINVANAQEIPDSARVVATWNSAWGSVDDKTGVWLLQKDQSGHLQWFRTGCQLM